MQIGESKISVGVAVTSSDGQFYVIQPMETNHLPTTNSIDEPAPFWDEHDLSDSESEPEEVAESGFVRGREPTRHFYLSWQQREGIKKWQEQNQLPVPPGRFSTPRMRTSQIR